MSELHSAEKSPGASPSDWSEAVKQTASNWSSPRPDAVTKSRWWHHQPIHDHRNRLIAGEDAVGSVVGGDIGFLLKRQPGGFGSAVSVGCGTAFKELTLLRNGVVGHFTVYEVAEARVAQAMDLARQWDLTDRITIIREVRNFQQPGEYDLVYWNDSLHHMFDVAQAIEWSRRSLRPGGAFYMNDCIAPDRLQ